MSHLRARAVVLSCRGGAQGDLSVVRTLGRAGVPVTVVSEYENSPARRSRYTSDFRICPGLSRDPDRLLACLRAVARDEITRPVLFPTADPDLAMVSELRQELVEHYRLFVSRRELIENLTDKARFFRFARRFGFPVPATWVPRDGPELERLARRVEFPIIVKPVVPQRWSTSTVAPLVDRKKALRVNDPEALIELYRRLAPHAPEMVLQEYVPGADDRLYSMHVYMDQDSRPLGVFTGQKVRTWPTYAGIGCFVRSTYVPEIVDLGIGMLQRIRYTGLALLQFKKDQRDGRFRLLEINPRSSSWNLLAYACGVNLPYLAYRDAVGMPVPEQRRQKEGIRYVFLEHDVRAFLDYRRNGDWTLGSWVRSLAGRNVYQLLAWDDLRPFLDDVAVNAGRGVRKMLQTTGMSRHA